MKTNKNSINFSDTSRELCIVLTMTSWNEPPRIRHEITYQLARRYNVLFLQLYQSHRLERPSLKYSNNIIVDKVGFGFRGMFRIFKYFPFFHRLYNLYLAKSISRKINKYNLNESSLIFTFQYDFPEVLELNQFSKKVYFCNDDFVNQDLNASNFEVQRKDNLQRRVVSLAQNVITVSLPLKYKLERYGKPVDIILSGHSFDLNISRSYKLLRRDRIHVCYMGFFNYGIAIDWLEFILTSNRIHLTVVGPVEIVAYLERMKKFPNFTHISSLSGEELQLELLSHDVLLMPYSSPVENAVTTVPAKLYQYLAVGKPIVSSSLENLIKLPDGFVYKSITKEEFLSNIFTAYSNDSFYLADCRINEADKHTWYSKGNELFNLLDV